MSRHVEAGSEELNERFVRPADLPAAAAETVPAIADYAAIGDCNTVALVSRAGSVDWLCLPTYSGTGLFSALLDPEKGGRFLVTVPAANRIERSYVDGTNVLSTTFHAESGVATLCDCMVVPAPGEEDDLRPENELLRIVECISGEVEVRIRFEPRPGFGARAPRLRRLRRLGWQCLDRGMETILQCSVELTQEPTRGALYASCRLRAGESLQVSLAHADREICPLPAMRGCASQRRDGTIAWWSNWSAQCAYEGLHADAVSRSVLALKLLASSVTGAVMAAPTTSLPEQIGGSRNWDYRFCWIRDSAFVLQSFMTLGFVQESVAFQRWLLRAVRLPLMHLQVVYDLWGETRLRERTLDWLSGYRDSRPVRTGNAASNQLQLDLYGELIFAMYEFVLRGGVLDASEQSLLASLGNRVARNWTRLDQGIWESRGPARPHTFSRAMCWVALDRLLYLHDHIALPLDADRIRVVRDRIREDIEHNGFNADRNAYVNYYGSTEPDASLLLLARYGYVDPLAPRMVGTFELIERELTDGALVWRYRQEADYDGIEGGQGAFLPCTFWAIEYLALAGRLVEAATRLAAALEFCNDVGLLSEVMDQDGRTLIGNFPQALTHVSLISAVLAVDRAQKQDKEREQAQGQEAHAPEDRVNEAQVTEAQVTEAQVTEAQVKQKARASETAGAFGAHEATLHTASTEDRSRPSASAAGDAAGGHPHDQ